MARRESLCGREEVRAVGGFAELKRGNGVRDEIALGFDERDIFQPPKIDGPVSSSAEERKPGLQLGNVVQRESPPWPDGLRRVRFRRTQGASGATRAVLR